eukprot:gnl/Hemi2/23546_TR7901_c0_g1_i1.p2 gnl/Hemi2/23546_TR7901_c0_g1~~gnl/Hemi2/23546_TR7901_c0_g1_i1.p2  ORF type:complete len:200 (+),score=17.36 gnl/Hemi2/23546_TR7901_c0_g1_i1:266-865(+)
MFSISSLARVRDMWGASVYVRKVIRRKTLAFLESAADTFPPVAHQLSSAIDTLRGSMSVTYLTAEAKRTVSDAFWLAAGALVQDKRSTDKVLGCRLLLEDLAKTQVVEHQPARFGPKAALPLLGPHGFHASVMEALCSEFPSINIIELSGEYVCIHFTGEPPERELVTKVLRVFDGAAAESSQAWLRLRSDNTVISKAQ